MAENGLISGVGDVPDWLARNFPGLTGPARVVANAMKLPATALHDTFNTGKHRVLGLDEASPMESSQKTTADLLRAVRDTYGLIEKPRDAISTTFGDAMDRERERMIAAGARPSQPQVPGLNISPQIPGGFGAPSARPTAPPSPAARARAAVVPQGGTSAPTPMGMGALGNDGPDLSTTDLGGGYSGIGPVSMAAASNAPAATPAAGASLPKSLQEQFRARLKEAPEANAELTPAQQAKLQLDFFLRLMSGGSKPGARSVGVIGDAGLATSAEHEALLDKARGVAEKRRGEARDDAFKEMGFADKDEDNKRAAEQLRMMEDHYKRTDANAAEHMAILRQQLEQGKSDIRIAPDGRAILHNKITNKIEIVTDPATGKPLSFKAPEKPTESDRAIALMRQEGLSSKEILDRLYPDKSKQEKDNSLEMVKEAGRRSTSDVTGKTISSRALDDVMRELQRARSGQPNPVLPEVLSRKSQDYLDTVKANGGDAKRVEAALIKMGVKRFTE